MGSHFSDLCSLLAKHSLVSHIQTQSSVQTAWVCSFGIVATLRKQLHLSIPHMRAGRINLARLIHVRLLLSATLVYFSKIKANSLRVRCFFARFWRLVRGHLVLSILVRYAV